MFAAILMCAGISPRVQSFADKPNITAKGERIRAAMKEKRRKTGQQNKHTHSSTQSDRGEASTERVEHRHAAGNRNFRYTKTGKTDFKRY